VAINPDYDAYEAASDGVFAIFSTITPHVERVSLDEAFLDLTGTRRLLGEPEEVGELIRALVADEQGIPCSVGIAPTKLIAKMSSNRAKPNGLFRVHPGEVIGFLHPQTVEKSWGVGPATTEKLHKLGLHTIADVAHTPKSTLQRAFGARAGGELWECAWGIDGRRVVATEPTDRSVGSQETFGKDTDDLDFVRAELLRTSVRVTSRMRLARVVGRTVTLTLRFADFRTVQKSLTLPYPTDATDEVYAAAVRLLRAFRLERPRLRRVGIRVEHVLDVDQVATQPALDEPERGWREAERAADAAIARFGPHAVSRATLTRRAGSV
jgi:DNA polymerase-4